MSENLPQPLPGAPALRAHLKALERGVADARSQRLGVPPPNRAVPSSNGIRPGMYGGTIGGTPAPRAQASTSYTMPKPANPAAAPTRVSDKPRAARAKSANDFGAFFDKIEKREAS